MRVQGTPPGDGRARLSTEQLRAAVLDACRRAIAAGLYPTTPWLRDAVPGYHPETLRTHRRVLRRAGLIDWSHLGEHDNTIGLPCRTEADQAVIRERARLVRLGIDPDSGRALPPREGEPAMAQDRRTYTDIKCETCGVPWESHGDDCPRPRHRPGGPWVARARELRRAWEARRAAAARNTPEIVP